MHTASDIPNAEPREVVAGNTIKWKRSLNHYSAADGWVLTYFIFGRNGNYTFAATADGTQHSVTVAISTTETWQPGDYTFQGYVTKAGERFLVYDNRLTINRNPANLGSETHDERSHAKKCLDAIEALLEGRASRADRSYTVAGRQLDYFSPKELLELRDYYKAEVAIEEAKDAIERGEGHGGVLIRFNRP